MKEEWTAGGKRWADTHYSRVDPFQGQLTPKQSKQPRQASQPPTNVIRVVGFVVEGDAGGHFYSLYSSVILIRHIYSSF
jgi:hypothetical protein